MYKYLSSLFSFFANLVPTTKVILFHSFPDVSDNSFAMCRYLHLRGTDKMFSFVWLVENVENKKINETLEEEGIHALLVKRKSIKGVWMFLRARFVFVTHGLFDDIRLHQHKDKVINLWHGMPLKLLGASENRGIPCSMNSNLVVASSLLYQKIMSEAFSVMPDHVLVTGQPRCDLLFEKSNWFENNGIKKTKYKSIGIWLPTYRKSIIGDIRIDGEYNDHGVSFLSEDDMRNLDLFLREKNILVLIKIHPMDALQNASFESFTNIILIKPQEFNSQLYPLLGSCDFLLTDYSSVFIDYQILRRPIGFVMNDIEIYKNSRGFYFTDIEKALPGPIISNYDMLCSFIQSPYYTETDMNYNDFFDNESSKRICDFLHLN